jgi:hypothetical protein
MERAKKICLENMCNANSFGTGQMCFSNNSFSISHLLVKMGFKHKAIL